MTLHRFMACNSNIIGLETINDVIYNNLCLMFPPNVQAMPVQHSSDGKKGCGNSASLHTATASLYDENTPSPVFL